MLEPGTRVSHRAAALAARVGTLLVWVGEAGVRLYSSGQPGGARADRLLYQAKLALDENLRLKVVRRMYALRFGEEPPVPSRAHNDPPSTAVGGHVVGTPSGTEQVTADEQPRDLDFRGGDDGTRTHDPLLAKQVL